MGLVNWYRFSNGTQSRGRVKAVGLVLALKIKDSAIDRARPKSFTIADIAFHAGYSALHTSKALDKLQDIGEVEREGQANNPHGYAYRIAWEALKPVGDHESDHAHEAFGLLTTGLEVGVTEGHRRSPGTSNHVVGSTSNHGVGLLPTTGLDVKTKSRKGAASAGAALAGVAAEAPGSGSQPNDPWGETKPWIRGRIQNLWGLGYEAAGARFNAMTDDGERADLVEAVTTTTEQAS